MEPARRRILLIEDEPSIADTLNYALATEGFDVDWVSTGREGLRRVADTLYACVVLDVGLPDMSGFEVCRQLRTRSAVPVLFLTARQSEVDRIVGLELGADDYVAKPFSPRELSARVRAILRRGRLIAGSCEESGDSGAAPGAAVFENDCESCSLRFQGQVLRLTRNEYRLLSALLEKPGRVLSREALLAKAWDEPEASMDRTVDAHVKSLRAKLREVDASWEPIVTHRGFGYSALAQKPADGGRG